MALSSRPLGSLRWFTVLLTVIGSTGAQFALAENGDIQALGEVQITPRAVSHSDVALEMVPARMPNLVALPVGYHSAVCSGCNQVRGGCLCGQTGDGGCSIMGTNLFWCNPYPDAVVDPCGETGCENCMYSEAPLLFASVELVPIYRDQADDPLFQTLGRGGRPVLETGDFETEFDAGMRLVLGATLTERYRIEAAYLGGYEWSDRVAIRNNLGNLYSPFSNFGVPVVNPAVDLNNFASIEMTSSFNSAEFNIRRRCCNLPKLWPYRPGHYGCAANSFLVGLRYLNVDEQFRYSTQSAAALNDAIVNTENDLFGVQVGMLSQFATRWSAWIDLEVKGGIYQNQADMTSDYLSTGRGAAQFVGSDSVDRTSFLGELSLNYNHQVTSNLSMRLGYNAFWLTGVALASENLATNRSILSRGPAQISHDGDVVYHGPSLGFTFAY